MSIIRALVVIKRSMALANARYPEITGVDAAIADAISRAADEVLRGDWDDQFAIDTFQTGSGTSTNMNVNEVLAALAARHLAGTIVHPNDHVNASQSTNDVFPTALRIAVLSEVRDVLMPGLDMLRDGLIDRAEEFADVVKAGRTHLMDASPITLGQEFGGYAAQIAEARDRLSDTMVRVAAIPLGGTATGNGLNAPDGVADMAIADIARATGLAVYATANRFASQASPDSLVELSGQLRVTATAMFKIANDIRLLASGPHAGFAEIWIPELQPGSSIMPGKVNPVLCEVVTQVAAQVVGHDAAVGFAGSQGTLEMNTYLPVIADNLLAAVSLLGRAAGDFGSRCVLGIEADRDRCRAYAQASPAIAAALNPLIGYDVATQLVRRAEAEHRTLRDVVLDSGVLDPGQVDAALDVDRLARGSDGR
jgi:fumarate hydratase class II